MRYEALEGTVGTGAACDRIEKWMDVTSQEEIAVKVVPKRLRYLAQQEILALLEVKRIGVSRVANLLDYREGLEGHFFLMLQLVNGFNLYQYSSWRNGMNSHLDVENNMLTVAVQLFETLSELHAAQMAHLDVKGDNVMLMQNTGHAWDTLRLIDFAMAVKCSSDCAIRDVKPQGHAYGASAPELMSASLKVKAGLFEDKYKINGCAADIWSAGTVLYEMLTGYRAFNPAFPLEKIEPVQDQMEWPSTVLKQTELLRSSISSAKSHSDLLKHPMFKEIARCTSRPKLAVDFFRGLFEDSPMKRMTAAAALRHPYLQDCLEEMQQARQGNPRYSHNKQQSKPPKGGFSKLKRALFGEREQQTDNCQHEPPPCDLELFFPPFEVPCSKWKKKQKVVRRDVSSLYPEKQPGFQGIRQLK